MRRILKVSISKDDFVLIEIKMNKVFLISLNINNMFETDHYFN